MREWWLVKASAEQAFREYVTARMPALMRTAHLLCGSHGRAEDVVSTAMVRLYVSWRRASGVDHLDTQVWRALVKAWLDELSRPWRKDGAPQSGRDPKPADSETVDDTTVGRTDLGVLLDHLPQRQRIVLVLRFCEDRSVEQTAQILGCSADVVTTLTTRALTTIHRSGPAPRGDGTTTGEQAVDDVTTQLHDLAARILDEQPSRQSDFDQLVDQFVDQVVESGRRRARRHRLTFAGIATCAFGCLVVTLVALNSR